MFDASNFLMRWLFLSNMARDATEIQTLPYQPYCPPPPHPPHQSPRQIEEIWRDQCLRGILAYPPGEQRLMVMDSLRVELVQMLADKLEAVDDVVQKANKAKFMSDSSEKTSSDEDPYLDADVEILREFEVINPQMASDESQVVRNARLAISGNGADLTDSDSEEATPLATVPTQDEVSYATTELKSVRENMPQLVSAVLKSPPAYDDSPIAALRKLMIDRCLKDPSWGIELCWLLEADVGRAWKTLFEHRQQTGRRLIVVLPAEKAAVLAQIGSEKRESFDMLQEAEQATAYGYRAEDDHRHGIHSSRLPSSLSLRRCSHFGDTMHFIDRLTDISLDLRRIPVVERDGQLKSRLHEINRRIRRRMITQGEVSLDVEDHRNHMDWPTLDDLTVDSIKHSVHFPLVPQTGVWPGGSPSPSGEGKLPSESPEVVRVLNIIVPESRLLASRERCPYLLHMEVADAAVEGNDPLLYTTRSEGLGTTMEEALNLKSSSGGPPDSGGDSPSLQYEIPETLHGHPPQHQQSRTPQLESDVQIESSVVVNGKVPPRGGGQAESTFYFDAQTGYPPPTDYREPQYQQLHEEMQSVAPNPERQQPETQSYSLSLGNDLLDKIYGERWDSKCKAIKEASPFGNVAGWRLASFIMKAGEDIRQEALVMQIISKFQQWFKEIPEPYRPFMRPYTIMCVGGDAGLLECLSDAKSVDEVKKKTDGFTSLRDYFERAYVPRRYPDEPSESLDFETAQDNFLRSLVGYSLVCYVLQIKDRHNANIMIDREGHLIHIDFGFLLGDTPKMGKVPIFSERAPFKLSQEFWDVLGGWDLNNGGLGVRFCQMFERAFEVIAAHAEEIASLVEATVLALTSNPREARSKANGVRRRLQMRGLRGSREQRNFVMTLVDAALTSWGTTTYDWLQQQLNGYQ